MKSRLVTAIAIGALAAAALPGVASAAPDLSCAVDNANTCAAETQVTITVTEGTTIVAPGLVSIGSAFPGQMATSEPQDISWWSNQQGMTIFADLDSDPFIDNGAEGANNNIKDVDEASFAEDNVEIGSNDGSYYDVDPFDEMRPFNTADRGPDTKAVPIQDITFFGPTIESASTGQFQLEVHVPQATEGNYEAWMTYTVAAVQ